MEVWTVEKNVPFPLWDGKKRSAVALGGFDAMHIGHRTLISHVVHVAKTEGLTSVVHLFVNSPKGVLEGKEIPAINTLKKRLEILKDLGVDLVVAQTFTTALGQCSPEDFVRKVLAEGLGASYAAVGFNYRFGQKGRGDAALLKKLGAPLGIRVCEIPGVRYKGEVVSSTRIRQGIRDGDMETATACLGRPFSLQGTVIRGNQIGRTLGFPTANLQVEAGLLLPRSGVYLTRALVGEKEYPSMTHVGQRPTVEAEGFHIESHLVGFSGDLYSQSITVEFLQRMRDIVPFSDLSALQRQLTADQNRVKDYFAQ